MYSVVCCIARPMGTRKHISWRTLAAAALLALGRIPYKDAKAMGEANFLSLWVHDHNMLHETGHPDRDEFWNLTPMLIAEHRKKTKQDIKIVAKSRRIRKKLCGRQLYNEIQSDPASAAPGPWKLETQREHAGRPFPAKRKIRSRGFDKTRRRKMSGTVVKRT